MNQDFLEDVKCILEGAKEKEARQKAGIRKEITAGDIYCFPFTAELGLEWILIRQHQDDKNLWFMVPLDHSLIPVGTWDIEVSEFEDIGPTIVRCIFMWIHISHLPLGEKTGFTEPSLLKKIEERISALVLNNNVENIEHVDCDPDYQEHIDTITKTINDFEMFLESQE